MPIIEGGALKGKDGAKRPKDTPTMAAQMMAREVIQVRVRVPHSIKTAFERLPFPCDYLSTLVEDAVATEELESVELLEPQLDLCPPTRITILHHVHSALKKAAHHRHCSLDRLIGSVLTGYLRGFSDMPVAERLRDIDEAKSGLTNVAMAEYLNPSVGDKQEFANKLRGLIEHIRRVSMWARQQAALDDNT